MKKICLFLLFLLFSVSIYVESAYAYKETWSWADSPGGTNRQGHAEVTTTYISEILNPVVNSIKFRQDENYYYFDFDIDYKSSILRKNYMSTNAGMSSIFASQLKDTWPYFDHYWSHNYSGAGNSNDSETSKGSISFGSGYFSYNLVRRQRYSRGSLDEDYYATENVGNCINIPVSGLSPSYYYNSPKYLHGLYVNYTNYSVTGLENGSAIINVSNRSLSNDYWQYKYTGTMKVKKDQFEKYKYLSLLATSALYDTYRDDYNTNNGGGEEINYDIRGKSIDLTPYANCEHNWFLVNIGDKTVHERRCSKCEWPIKENHELLFDYDGLSDNMCACGYAEIVKYNFILNDDVNGEIEKHLHSYEPMPDIELNNKTGYKFKWFEIYEKHKNSDGTYLDAYIATSSTIDTVISNYSTTYKAIYEPITYTFHFSNENNMDLPISGSVSDQTFTYDTPLKINDGISYTGRNFIGWTFTKGSNVPDIKKSSDVLNYSAEDMSEFVLYPVYEHIRFTIRYNTPDGHFRNGKKSISVKYMYDDETWLERPSDYYPEASFRYYNYNDKIINTIDDIKPYAVLQDMIFTFEAYIYTPNISKNETSADGAMPTADGGLSYNDKKDKNSKNINENIDENIDFQDDYLSNENDDASTNTNYNKNRKKQNGENLDENQYGTSKNYELLMQYLRDKYEKEKNKVTYARNKYTEKEKRDYIGGNIKSTFLTTMLYRHFDSFVIVFTVLVVGACLFLVDDDDDEDNVENE